MNDERRIGRRVCHSWSTARLGCGADPVSQPLPARTCRQLPWIHRHRRSPPPPRPLAFRRFEPRDVPACCCPEVGGAVVAACLCVRLAEGGSPSCPVVSAIATPSKAASCSGVNSRNHRCASLALAMSSSSFSRRNKLTLIDAFPGFCSSLARSALYILTIDTVSKAKRANAPCNAGENDSRIGSRMRPADFRQICQNSFSQFRTIRGTNFPGPPNVPLFRFGEVRVCRTQSPYSY